MRTTYGNFGNPIEDQYKYMKLRLKSKKAGVLKDTPENIQKFEDKIKRIDKSLKDETVTEKVKKVETEQDILKSKISKMESTLSNEKFRASVSNVVIGIKMAELEMLKDELKKYSK